MYEDILERYNKELIRLKSLSDQITEKCNTNELTEEQAENILKLLNKASEVIDGVNKNLDKLEEEENVQETNKK